MSALFIRLFNLLFFPAKEWKTIAGENKSRKTVYKQFVIPLLCLITVASIIGTYIYTTRVYYSLGYVICEIAVWWTSLSVGLFVSSFFVTEIMAQQLGYKNHNRDFALMAYSSCAAYLVITVVVLFPFPYFKMFLVLAFFSFYLYWTGIPYLIKAESRERTFYGLLSFVIILITYILAYFLFRKIFVELLVSS